MLADIDSYRGRLISGLNPGLESLAAFKTSPFGNPADPTPYLAIFTDSPERPSGRRAS